MMGHGYGYLWVWVTIWGTATPVTVPVRIETPEGSQIDKDGLTTERTGEGRRTTN